MAHKTHSRGRRYAAILTYANDAMFGKWWGQRAQLIHTEGSTLYTMAEAAHRAGLWRPYVPKQTLKETMLVFSTAGASPLAQSKFFKP